MPTKKDIARVCKISRPTLDKLLRDYPNGQPSLITDDLPTWVAWSKRWIVRTEADRKASTTERSRSQAKAKAARTAERTAPTDRTDSTTALAEDNPSNFLGEVAAIVSMLAMDRVEQTAAETNRAVVAELLAFLKSDRVAAIVSEVKALEAIESPLPTEPAA